MENIKQIKDYEQYYISDVGNVYSTKHNKMKKLKAGPNTGGYLMVALRKDNNYKQFLVHRLVAQAFIPNPENKPIVNHIDGNKQNNNVNNLEWCTYSENARYFLDVQKPNMMYELQSDKFKEYRRKLYDRKYKK